MKIIDIHTHAFPDHIAERALRSLSEEAQLPVYTDGTIEGLISSMDRAGIQRSVVASIATKPGQFESIFEWSKNIASQRIIPFPSVHPSDPKAAEKITAVSRAGFKGIKLHPYYQSFTLDGDAMGPVYRSIEKEGLVLLLHTGYDTAFPRDRIGDPEKIMRVLDSFPDLKLVTTHLGAWEDWEDVERLILGKPVYMDISFSFHLLGMDRSRKFLIHHPQEYLVFGSDSPWDDQKELVDTVLGFDLPKERLEALMWKNAARLLDL